MILTLLLVTVCSAVAASPGELERFLDSIAAESDSVNVTNAETLFADGGLAAVEGVWRITGSEGIFAVKGEPGSIFYRMILIDSPDRLLRPGTVMGALTALGRKDSYDAMIFTTANDGELSAAKRFTVTLTEEGRMTIVPIVNELKINLWRMLPYMFRHAVKRVNDRPNNLDGALRLYPEPSLPIESPRYL